MQEETKLPEEIKDIPSFESLINSFEDLLEEDKVKVMQDIENNKKKFILTNLEKQLISQGKSARNIRRELERKGKELGLNKVE